MQDPPPQVNDDDKNDDDNYDYDDYEDDDDEVALQKIHASPLPTSPDNLLILDIQQQHP